MKGFFAFIIDTLRNVDIDQLKHPIYILATADQETTMTGAGYFATTVNDGRKVIHSFTQD